MSNEVIAKAKREGRDEMIKKISSLLPPENAVYGKGIAYRVLANDLRRVIKELKAEET